MMHNPFNIENGDEADAGLALEDLISSTAKQMGVSGDCRSIQSHTDFELPNDEGALIVVRFAGSGSVQKAKRLRKLIDAWE